MTTKTILLVEDDELCCEMYRYKLEKEGFELVIKHDGAEALFHLSETDKKPDLMLLDLAMPTMDGFEVLKHVRAAETLQGFRVIVFSALAEARDCCLGLGAHDFIAKTDVTPKQLAEKLKLALAS